MRSLLLLLLVATYTYADSPRRPTFFQIPAGLSNERSVFDSYEDLPSLEDFSDERIIFASNGRSFQPTLISPALQPSQQSAPEPFYGAPQPSYQAPAPACEPIVQYSVVTNQVFVPQVKEVTKTRFLGKTIHRTIEVTKVVNQPITGVVTVTEIPPAEVIVKTDIIRDPLYVKQVSVQRVTEGRTATQVRVVTNTKLSVQTKINTVTKVQFRTKIEVKTHTEFHTNFVTKTEVVHQTATKYRQRNFTKTVQTPVPVFKTVVETAVQNQYITISEKFPVYQTQFVTKTVTAPCGLNYY